MKKACTIYSRAGMVELIEMALLCPTVTSGAPVGDQVSKISRFNSVGPSGDPYVRWQTGVCQTISKIIQHVHRNRDLEGFAHIHSWNAHLSNCGIHGSVPDREPGLKGASPPIGCPPSISLLSSSRQSPRGRRLARRRKERNARWAPYRRRCTLQARFAVWNGTMYSTIG